MIRNSRRARKATNQNILHEHLALITIKDRRTYSDEFKTGLGFNAYDAINTKEQTVLQEIMRKYANSVLPIKLSLQ